MTNLLKINKKYHFVLVFFGNKYYNQVREMLPDKSVSGGGIGFWYYLHESKQIKSQGNGPG